MDDTSMTRLHAAALALVVVLLSTGCHCHTDIAQRDKFAVVGGHKLTSIQYMPYHVGIYRSLGTPDNVKHICSGTLISTIHVVSAAHCFWNEKTGAPNDHNTYKITAGKRYREWGSLGDAASVQRKSVANLTLPRRYLGDAQSQAYDIAVVTLDSPMTLTDSVCVADVDWFDEWTAEQMTSGSNGVVAGWGITDTGLFSETLNYVTLPYVDPDTCFDSLSRDLKKFVTHDKFCAGFLHRNVSVCPGDSGGGLVFHHPGTGKHFLRGVVSMGFRPAWNMDACFAQHYAAFTTVSSEVLQMLLGHLPVSVQRTRGFRGQGRGSGLYDPTYRQRHRSRSGSVVEDGVGRRVLHEYNEGRRVAGGRGRRS